MENKTWQVEEIETEIFDKKGKLDGTWKGYAVTLIDDPVNYCFECRDKINAGKLCEFLNNECNMDETSIEDFVMDNCREWGNLIMTLSKKEKDHYRLKNEYKSKSYKLLEDARKVKDETGDDIIKAKYGGNNDKTRAKYVKESLAEEDKQIKDLEFDIDYLKRRISYLKGLVYTKNALLNAQTYGAEK